MKYKLRRYYLYYFGRAGAFLIYLLPLRISLFLAGLLGKFAYLLLGRYRRVTVDNIRSVFAGQMTGEEIERLGRRVFSNLARNAVEMINFPKINKKNLASFVTVKGLENIEAALRRGRGVIVVTGHFGNWEIMPATFRILGYPGAAVGRRIYFHKYDRYLNSLRKCHDVNIIYRDESPKKILKVLKANGIIGIVADQDVDSVDGVFVDFFGRPAYTPAGPAALALVSGASLIPAFMLRQGIRHRLVVERPIDLAATGDKEKDILENTKRWSDVVESYIGRYPDHWVWMHRRWKTKKG